MCVAVYCRLCVLHAMAFLPHSLFTAPVFQLPLVATVGNTTVVTSVLSVTGLVVHGDLLYISTLNSDMLLQIDGMPKARVPRPILPMFYSG